MCALFGSNCPPVSWKSSVSRRWWSAGPGEKGGGGGVCWPFVTVVDPLTFYSSGGVRPSITGASPKLDGERPRRLISFRVDRKHPAKGHLGRQRPRRMFINAHRTVQWLPWWHRIRSITAPLQTQSAPSLYPSLSFLFTTNWHGPVIGDAIRRQIGRVSLFPVSTTTGPPTPRWSQ